MSAQQVLFEAASEADSVFLVTTRGNASRGSWNWAAHLFWPDPEEWAQGPEPLSVC